MPPATRLLMWLDYPPNDRTMNFETTVAQKKANNIRVHRKCCWFAMAIVRKKFY